LGKQELAGLSQILQVPVPFFFDRAPGSSGAVVEIADSDLYVNEFLTTSDGLASVKAFMRIRDPKLRRAIVLLVQQITPDG
jgi:hypothetical protein